MEEQKQTAGQQTTAIKKYDNISDQVLARIEQLQGDGGLRLPANYSVENHMKSAWLVLQATTDRNGKRALDVCTKGSIANALFDMVLQGLSVSKKQGNFIVYGNSLEFQRSYFGTMALAKRAGGIKGEPVANVIYEGDEFIYMIDPKTGRKSIVKHEQKLENIDNNKIVGAYAIVTYADGTTEVTIMSMAQIRAAWNQGATKGNSPAHKNFTDEMAKKTVIGRACKAVINSSDDAWLYEGKADTSETDIASRQRESAIVGEKQVITETDYEDLTDAPQQPAETPATEAPTPVVEAEVEDPGY
jgi:recombination protein RecT